MNQAKKLKKAQDIEDRLNTARSNFNRLKQFAETHSWLILHNTEENENFYSHSVWLTPIGLLVEASISEDGLEVNNTPGTVEF